MKVRKGFVSNSSSSSFVCDVSGYETSGMELDTSVFGGCNCTRGHEFLEKFLYGVKSYEEMVNIIHADNPDYDPDDDDDFEDIRYEVPPRFCPLCQLKAIRDDDLAAYMLKLKNTTKEIMLEEIEKRFKNYDNLKKFLAET